MENYKQKYLKYKSKYLRLKAQLGGHLAEIELSKVLLRPSMIKYIKANHPEIDLSNFKISHVGEVGSLTRMEHQNSLSNEQFMVQLKDDPVSVSSKGIQYKNPETGETEIAYYYEIVNGRHRITSAIIRGFTKINANISYS